METTKQEKTMNEIIYAITHGEKKAGDMILSRDYDLAKKQMSIIFKMLSDKKIVERNESNFYILTENGADNAQEIYFEKIVKAIRQIKILADSANISTEILLDIFKNEIID